MSVDIVAPPDADALAAVLADAARAGKRVVVRGGGTKLDWTSATAAPDLIVSTERLDRVVAHRHGDLTATVEAGAILGDVNRALGAHGQWIPLDPPWTDRATVGGIVAANDSGPRRHRFGAPRDLIIGVEIARADGVRAKAGGIVVKNVAGYDLPRLMTGSFGCLAVILSATFKLYPRAEASRTVLAELSSTSGAGALALALNASQLTPTAVEIAIPPQQPYELDRGLAVVGIRMLVRFESTVASVDAQSRDAVRLVERAGGRATVLRDEEEAATWRRHGERPWNSRVENVVGTENGHAAGAVLKLTMLPESLGETLDAFIDRSIGCEIEVVGRAGLGVLTARIDGRADAQVRTIAALRERCQPGRGSVVVLRASDEVRTRVGVWGPMGDSFRVMQAVKRSFDPLGLLNSGRGPGGL